MNQRDGIKTPTPRAKTSNDTEAPNPLTSILQNERSERLTRDHLGIIGEVLQRAVANFRDKWKRKQLEFSFEGVNFLLVPLPKEDAVQVRALHIDKGRKPGATIASTYVPVSKSSNGPRSFNIVGQGIVFENSRFGVFLEKDGFFLQNGAEGFGRDMENDRSTRQSAELSYEKAFIIQTLNQIKAKIDLIPELRAVFESHALASEANAKPVTLPPPALSDEARLKPPRVKWMERGEHPKLANLDPPSFIKAIYGSPSDRRLGNGFTQADLKKVDPSLYNALQRFPASELPNDFDLPTLEEWNHRQLEAMGLLAFVEDPSLRKWLAVASGRAQRLSKLDHNI